MSQVRPVYPARPVRRHDRLSIRENEAIGPMPCGETADHNSLGRSAMSSSPGPPTLRTGKLCYIEIPASDVHKSADFYERAFGWNIRFRDTDRPSFDDTTGEVSGAFVGERTPAREAGFMLYVMAADAAAVANAVIAAGGEIVLPVGQYRGEVLATFRDPAGNLMGIYQQPGLAKSEGA